LEELLELTPPEHFQKFMVRFFLFEFFQIICLLTCLLFSKFISFWC
jgi:hypothetical protein